MKMLILKYQQNRTKYEEFDFSRGEGRGNPFSKFETSIIIGIYT